MFQRTRALLHHLSSGSAIAEDRRLHSRHDTEMRTVCRPVPEGTELGAWIRNVSRSGVNLTVSQEFAAGSMIQVDLPHAIGGAHTTVLACIVHSLELGPDEWSLGCQFSLELNDDELKLFGGEKQKPKPEDQRAWVRFPAKGTAEYHVLPGGGEPPEVAEIANISPAGIGLLTDEPLDPGVVISLTLRRNQQKPDLTMLACVVYLTDRSDGKWAAGCNFIRELSEKELNELL